MAFWRRFRTTRLEEPAATGVPGILLGYCDLRLGRLTGWVEDEFGPSRGPIEISFVRHGHAVRTIAVSKGPNDKRFQFSAEVSDILTGADLVQEDVRVLARNAQGDTGEVRLDGAAQLEFIRDVYGIPVAVCADIHFTSNGNSAGHLAGGWSGAEENFTWTEGVRSDLVVPTPTEPGTYTLRITAGGHIYAPGCTSQSLQVFVNDAQVGAFASDQAAAQFFECTFSHEAFSDEPTCHIRLEHPDAVRPCDYSRSNDDRLLALSFRRVTIARIL